MPYTPFLPVVPPGEYLLHPFHDFREFKPVFRLQVKRQPVILNTHAAQSKDEPEFRFQKHPGKEGSGFGGTEQGFPVVDAGADAVPHPLFE
jgi:hypothetical protein